MSRRPYANSLLVGLVIGLVVGSLDLLLTWVSPQESDADWVVLAFYGPMFVVWSSIAFRAARETGRVSEGVLAGVAIAFGTFSVFIVLNFLRVNLFFDQLVDSPGWENMMMRFRTSGAESARLFVNVDYIKGTPFKIGFFAAIGGVLGALGGSLGRLTRRTVRTA
jgi:hypothetical protein